MSTKPSPDGLELFNDLADSTKSHCQLFIWFWINKQLRIFALALPRKTNRKGLFLGHWRVICMYVIYVLWVIKYVADRGIDVEHFIPARRKCTLLA